MSRRWSVNWSIKQRMLFVFSLIMMITVLMSVWSFYTAVALGRTVESQYRTELFVEQLRRELGKSKKHLTLFLMTQRREGREEVAAALSNLERLTADRRAVTMSRELLMVKNISFLVDKYRAHVSGVMEARGVRDSMGYSESYAAAENVASYINIYIDKVLLSNLQNRAAAYRSFSEWYQRILSYNFLLIFLAVILTVLFLLLFTERLTRPMVRLAYLADEISRGNFEVEDIQADTGDEIAKTAGAFNAMKNSIRTYVLELQNKAEVERRLAEQKVENLEIQHLLNNVEIESLRSQMNPHFLFNTLNTGVQLAIMEDAERTADFMNNLSRLFRHNVRRLEGDNRIREEIEGLRYYSELLSVRFGDLYVLELDIDTQLLDIRFPPLIFQPLVENAILHGFSDFEGSGCITVSGRARAEGAFFAVTDNGCGIPEETIRHALSPITYSGEDFSGRGGLGLRSVVLRLRLFFEEERCVGIRTAEGGTSIEVVVPWEKVVYV